MTSIVEAVPLIDLKGADVPRLIQRACEEWGFFVVTGHDVDGELIAALKRLSAAFFALEAAEKNEIRMELGGAAWRGYFPVGQEQTSGKPDQKEGLYFGVEQEPDGRPLHGRNLFPTRPDGFKKVVLAYMEQVTRLGHLVVRAIAQSLGLPETFFEEGLTKDPLILFRIFHYPSLEVESPFDSVGEHTDYGFLTLLLTDDVPGLQVRSPKTGLFVEIPPLEGAFVCNLGDQLDRLTNGRYRSTPHRVRNVTKRSRLSFPLFFDPGFDQVVEALPGFPVISAAPYERWDGQDLYNLVRGSYGAYLVEKVSSVFPHLAKNNLD